LDGSWGTIYDEGLVVDVMSSEERLFYGHFGYEHVATMGTATPLDIEPDSGGIISHCNIIPRGWLIRRGPGGNQSLHCFTAEQTKKAPGPVQIPETSAKTIQLIYPAELKISHWEFPLLDSPTKQNQGSCGSCFVLSYAYALERIVMNIYDIYGIQVSVPTSVDREAILSCSVSNQGCSGGFYNSLTLDLMVSGVPSSGCMDKERTQMSYLTGLAQSCNKHCYDDPQSLIYTAGYTELKSEDSIKEFLINHGPVPVGISMSAEHHNSLRGGSQSTIIHLPDTPSIEGWDKLNHGIAIIGWGVSNGEPFWEVYNPWGGPDTFAKIARKPNGVPERNAIGIRVDLCKGVIHKELVAAGKDPVECKT
jgi:hypothetical protein